MSADKLSVASNLGTTTGESPVFGKTDLETPSSVPLVVDLDGTLVKTDLLWESIFALLQENIFFLLLLPFWLLSGRARMKREISKRITLEVATLPYNDAFLEFLRKERGRGRELVLATASDEAQARAIADHLGIFSEVLASDGRRNIKGGVKLKALQDRFGQGLFDYAGNSQADVTIWQHSRAAIVVSAPDRIVRRVASAGHVAQTFERRENTLASFIEALRIRHWIKNALVFVPLIAAQELEKYQLVIHAVYAFGAFSLIASSVYVFNDLADIFNDRQHSQKRMRPFAAGRLSLSAGLWLIPLLMVAAAVICALLPREFLAVISIYLVLNVAYSLYLKKILLLDVILLAIFYTLRVIAGGIATGLVASHWLLVFSVFIFLSLAFAKRVSELQALRAKLKNNAEGRDYRATDLEQLANLGAAGGYISVLVFLLYLDSPSARLIYSSSAMLWIVCPLLLYWISRLWVLVHRGQLPEDPIVFVFHDKISWLIGAAIGVLMILAG